jgi:carbon-monoxide dehydrogenase medium subunit
MALWQKYLRPKSLSEALAALASAPRPLAPIAGGTDLLIDLEQGRHAPVHTLVDISEVSELLALEIRGDRLFVGAGLPVGRIVTHPDVLTHAQALAEACALIAGPQVRNVATLGGNVAHALPAADGTIALLALGAAVEIAGPGGSRMLQIGDLFLGPGRASLEHEAELLVGFHLPLSSAGNASCFKRIMRPQGVALPILNCAVWLRCQDDRVAAIRIAVGPGGPIPWRALQAENFLIGKALHEQSIQGALDSLLAEAGFRSSARRASAEYRRHLVTTLITETLQACWARV